MQTKTLYLFTRTPLHVGAGSSVGAIDQPIQRERHTGFPVIPGSSLKGVLRDLHRRKHNNPDTDRIFGEQEKSGAISVGEAKIATFPVRSAKGGFAFITCPVALERLKRAIPSLPEIPGEPSEMECLGGPQVVITKNSKSTVVLEEFGFKNTASFPVEWEQSLLGLLDDAVWKSAKGRLVLLGNGDFAHFAKNACEVNQHVAIDPTKGTAKPGALFNLEAVPSETLFVSTIAGLARESGELEKLQQLIQENPLLQIGGDATTGLGFCSAKLA